MKLTQELIFEIKNLYAQGFTVGEIARQLNITESVVVKVLGIR